MAYARERSLTGLPISGSKTRISSGVVETNTVLGLNATCVDIVGSFNTVNVFTLHRVTRAPGMMYGKRNSNLSALYIYNGAFYVNAPTDVMVNHVADPNEPSDVDASTQAVASANPSKPVASLPNLLWELRDSWKEIPSLLRMLLEPYVRPDVEFEIRGKRRKWIKRRFKRGRRTEGTNSQVGHTFGFETLFRDLVTLIDFSSSVDKRAAEVRAVYRKGGLKRRRQIYSGAVTSIQKDVLANSSDLVCRVDRYTTRKVDKWVTMRWLPNTDSIPSEAEMLSAIRANLHGWDLSAGAIAATLWEAMPWSWLIDYFGNIGSFLDANRNGLNLSVQQIAVMTRYETIVEDKNVRITNGIPGSYATGARYARISKYRKPGAVGLAARVPFLSHKQVLTLSSIAVNHNRLKKAAR